MDFSQKKTRKPNPVERANILSVLTMTYMFPVFLKSFRKGLTEDDLFRPLDAHKSSILGERIQHLYEIEHRKRRSSKYALHWALFKLVWIPIVFVGFLKLLDEAMLVVVMPLSIGHLLSYFEKGQTETSTLEAYLSAGAVILCLLMDAVIAHPTMMVLMHMTMKLRVACTSLVYRKSLRLNKSALANTTVGQIVNLLSNDVGKFDQGFLLCHYILIAPFNCAIGTYLIYREIGVSAFFGMAVLLSFVPLQIYMGKRTSYLRLKTALRTDERVRLMNEIISGIQIIKMYCWEKPFAKLIAMARKREMSAIRSHAYILGLIYAFEIFLTRCSIFVSILGYVLLGSFVNARNVFAIIAIYNVLRPVVTILFTVSITSINECNISVLRIKEFLDHGETEPKTQKSATNGVSLTDSTKDQNSHKSGRLVLENVSASWTSEASEDTLSNINLEIDSNQVVAVVGPVGSGKTSLFHVILQELPIKSGNMEIQGQISYACQEPWLFSASVRQNIVFGSGFDEKRYREVCRVCALEADLDMLPYGDKTLVGERGKALSGGQKARINLARCIYKKADIYLLDDPLSAVDANVGKHLYEKCVQGFLKDKICILITHQLQYLSSAHQILILKSGAVEIQGNYDELQNSGLNFAKLLDQYDNPEDFEESADIDRKKIKSRQTSECDTLSLGRLEEDDPVVEKEKQGTGNIKSALYWTYFKFGGGTVLTVFLIVAFLADQVVTNAGDYYVTYWVNLEQDFANNNSTNNSTLDRDLIIYEYSGIIAATVVFALVLCFYLMYFFAVASINIHKVCFESIVKATMRFYDNNPSGRILTRFSKDLGTIDEYIPPVLYDVISVFLSLAGALALSFIVDPWLMLPSVVLVVVFYFLRVIYMKTSRSVKRIEGIARGPILGHMTATMNGLSTVRAFNAQEILINEFDEYQDKHSSAWFLFIASNRCFGYWLDVFCISYMTVGIFALLYFNDDLYGGDVGLIVTQYVGLVGCLQWGMRQWSELENQMVSVERLLEYQKIDREPIREGKVPKNWPLEGKIEFQDVSLRYNPDDPEVLRDLNFAVAPGETIGIVGRTGAGKSSLIVSLFQLYPIQGRILIDSVDTTKIPLEDLRSKISIIPQEPVLFSGTLRKNLDPFEEYSDEILWNALGQVELKNVISELPSGLHAGVSEGGANFSVGQRQLVCLARALIRRNRILVMDEATANVDPHTDSLIQNTIREKFRECTVLTIAHRLHTVMDSDKILVMGSGRVQEYGHSRDLLRDEKGVFYNLVQDTGKATALKLEEISRQSYEKSAKPDA